MKRPSLDSILLASTHPERLHHRGREPRPGRVILNFDVSDARATAARIDDLGGPESLSSTAG